MVMVAVLVDDGGGGGYSTLPPCAKPKQTPFLNILSRFVSFNEREREKRGNDELQEKK